MLVGTGPIVIFSHFRTTTFGRTVAEALRRLIHAATSPTVLCECSLYCTCKAFRNFHFPVSTLKLIRQVK